MNLQAWKRVKVSDVGNIERAQAGKVYQGGDMDNHTQWCK